MKRTATAARPVSPAIGMTTLPESKPMRVLIVDDHPIVISGCRALLANDPDMVITTAADAEGGEASFVAEPPDVCLIDINLPSVSGFELARRILRRDASARIIMFSMNDDPVFAARAIEAGAKGYVSKSGDPDDLIVAIREVAKGNVFLPPSLAQSSRLRRTVIRFKPAGTADVAGNRNPPPARHRQEPFGNRVVDQCVVQDGRQYIFVDAPETRRAHLRRTGEACDRIQAGVSWFRTTRQQARWHSGRIRNGRRQARVTSAWRDRPGSPAASEPADRSCRSRSPPCCG